MHWQQYERKLFSADLLSGRLMKIALRRAHNLFSALDIGSVNERG
jgi:hypothetical protein